MTNRGFSGKIYNCHINREVLYMFYDEKQALRACEEEPSLIFELIKEGYYHLVDELISKNKVDMIVTDWNMPEMDGLTFVKAVRAKDEYKDLPILMITTEAAKEDILTALRSGVNNYVVKPFTPETLQEKVFKLLDL